MTENNIELMNVTDPYCSTDNVWRDDNMDQCLSDDLDTIEANISALQTGKANADHTHNYANATHNHTQYDISGLLTALSHKADDDHTHTGYATTSHTHTDYAPTTHSHSEYASTSHEHTNYATTDHTHTGFANATHTHAQADVTGLATALEGKAPASHTHPLSAITGILDVLMTGATGGVKHSYTTGNMLSIMNAWEMGAHTAYFMGGSTGCTNLPKVGESWRVLAHKTSNTIGWVLAFGSSGSIYSNYIDSGTWRGWRAIYDANPAPLWGTSGYYMTAGHTVTPTKKLSECAHGWILAWSDFDKDTATTNEKDWHFDVIPNKTPSGGTWSSKLMYFDIPRYIGDNENDIDTERRIIKQCYVSDDKIVGHDANNKDERHDVVLRAVYEF